jgi:YgiT-type zinc finger domain-containing protein
MKQGRPDMNARSPKETFIERQVTYTLEARGKFFIIEHVPARVCVETGEQLFSPETVERLQRTIWGRKHPSRLLETPVFEFAGSARRAARVPEKRSKTSRRDSSVS